MPKSLKAFIGILLLMSTVSLASCQSMLKIITSDKEQSNVRFER